MGDDGALGTSRGSARVQNHTGIFKITGVINLGNDFIILSKKFFRNPRFSINLNLIFR